jgi:penicillin-binding protein 2
MTALLKKNLERRKFIFFTMFIVVGGAFLIRLFMLQVVQEEYKLSAENNVLRYVTQYPPRGAMFDRNGKLMVFNEAAYDLLVVPKQVKPFDTTELCRLLDVTAEEVRDKLKKARLYSMVKPSIFLEQLSKEDFAYLEEVLFKFPGFYVQLRTIRKYETPIAAHVLGYIGEVDKRDIERDPYYRMGDYIGKSGVEKAYEPILRGRKGVKIKLVDVHNREMGSYKDGKYDSISIPGKNVILGLDAELQAYGEQLMRWKKGSVVAIEPSTGEILVMVSNPAYNPNLLVGRQRSKNYAMLTQDPMIPLFNRATQAQYPPGSTFKTISTLIGLQEGVLDVDTRYGCSGVGTVPISCSHSHPAPLSLLHALEQSCNPYFWQVFRSVLDQRKFSTMQEAYNYWREYVASFGVGSILEGEIPDQEDGNLPKDTYFDRYYGKKGWRPLTIRSLSIGQGEIEMTPLQLANAAAIFANRGYYYPPHFLKSVEGDPEYTKKYDKKIFTKVSEEYFPILVEGMGLVYQGGSGTARWYKIDSVDCCGKTGTAQNPHGKNHSIFIAFAPKDNPKIAIACVVENSGYGATWAAPIATLIMEKYLKGEVKQKNAEERMLNAYLLDDGQAPEEETKAPD